jgi:mRNA interferase RelE/StbE
LAWRIDFTSEARRQLRKLDPVIAKRIVDVLTGRIASAPRSTGKPLHGRLSSYRRYRVGDYRVICELQDDILRVLVIEVRHRRDVYKS